MPEPCELAGGLRGTAGAIGSAMHKLTLSVVAALSLVAFGCKNNDPLAKLQGFQQAMCECKDQACAEKVNVDMATWKLDLAKANDTPDPGLATKSGDIMMKYVNCATKLLPGTITNATGK